MKLAARIWEAAGGYAPTIGILGAVMGLIQVMENLTEPAKLGAGGCGICFHHLRGGPGESGFSADCAQAADQHQPVSDLA